MESTSLRRWRNRCSSVHFPFILTLNSVGRAWASRTEAVSCFLFQWLTVFWIHLVALCCMSSALSYFWTWLRSFYPDKTFFLQWFSSHNHKNSDIENGSTERHISSLPLLPLRASVAPLYVSWQKKCCFTLLKEGGWVLIGSRCMI